MLLPIVLLLATASPVQQTENLAIPLAPRTSEAQRTPADSVLNTFVRGPHGNQAVLDRGIISKANRSFDSGTLTPAYNGCLSIKAYVFSDGANPALQYVTDCPNLDAPYQVKHARKSAAQNQGPPTLRHTVLAQPRESQPIEEVSYSLDSSSANDTNVPSRRIRISAGVAAENVIYRVNPKYPVEAKKAHVQGVVVLTVLISKEGEPHDISVLSGPPELVDAAVDAVSQWRYKPYLLNGEPVEVETEVKINFSLAR